MSASCQLEFNVLLSTKPTRLSEVTADAYTARKRHGKLDVHCSGILMVTESNDVHCFRSEHHLMDEKIQAHFYIF